MKKQVLGPLYLSHECVSLSLDTLIEKVLGNLSLKPSDLGGEVRDHS